VLLIFILLVAGSFIYPKVRVDMGSFIGDERVTIKVQVDSGAKLSISEQEVARVEALLDEDPAVMHYSSRIEKTLSTVVIDKFSPSNARRPIKRVLEDLRRAFATRRIKISNTPPKTKTLRRRLLINPRTYSL